MNIAQKVGQEGKRARLHTSSTMALGHITTGKVFLQRKSVVTDRSNDATGRIRRSGSTILVTEIEGRIGKVYVVEMAAPFTSVVVIIVIRPRGDLRKGIRAQLFVDLSLSRLGEETGSNLGDDLVSVYAPGNSTTSTQEENTEDGPQKPSTHALHRKQSGEKILHSRYTIPSCIFCETLQAR